MIVNRTKPEARGRTSPRPPIPTTSSNSWRGGGANVTIGNDRLLGNGALRATGGHYLTKRFQEAQYVSLHSFLSSSRSLETPARKRSSRSEFSTEEGNQVPSRHGLNKGRSFRMGRGAILPCRQRSTGELPNAPNGCATYLSHHEREFRGIPSKLRRAVRCD